MVRQDYAKVSYCWAESNFQAFASTRRCVRSTLEAILPGFVRTVCFHTNGSWVMGASWMWRPADLSAAERIHVEPSLGTCPDFHPLFFQCWKCCHQHWKEDEISTDYRSFIFLISSVRTWDAQDNNFATAHLKHHTYRMSGYLNMFFITNNKQFLDNHSFTGKTTVTFCGQ